MHVLGDRLDLVLGEAAEAVLHHLEVAVEVAGTLLAQKRRQVLGGPVGGHERAGAGQRILGHAPRRLPSDHLDHEVIDRVGDERARDAGLDVTLGAVVKDGPGVLHGRGGVGEVVGDDLIGVEVGAAQVGGRCLDDPLGQVDGRGGGSEVRSRNSHG